uniref:cysteine dioxygenase n=1 Tax=Kalanchoe fedtschenkoi TaxID=63787 RepID=A0A7N0UZH8_KALFE
MGVGRFVGEREGRAFHELSKEANSRSKKVKRRQKKSASAAAAVQKVYETCKVVFASARTGAVPPADDVERLRSVLDTMKPEDVGLSPGMQYFKAGKDGQRPKITYLHLHECSKFSMGIFCLPPKAVIPLHNHPGMTVFSKLLFGTMHIKSYDWVDDVRCAKVSDGTPPTDPEQPAEIHSTEFEAEECAKMKAEKLNEVQVAENGVEKPGEVRLAKIKVDADFTAPCNTSILYPSEGGNLHCFTAVTACAVLDVLGPPYSDPEERHCTYYLEHPFANFSADGATVAEAERESLAWLEDGGDPEELSVVGAMYRGPKITE